MSSEVVGVDVSSIEVVAVSAVQIIDILPSILFFLFLISLRPHLSDLDRRVIGGEFGLGFGGWVCFEFGSWVWCWVIDGSSIQWWCVGGRFRC